MSKSLIGECISGITKSPVFFNHDLASHTSFRIGGPADVVVFPRSLVEVRKIVLNAANFEVPLTILGGGSNTLVKDRGIRGIVVIMSGWKINIKLIKKLDGFRVIKVAPGIDIRTICSFSIKNNLSGVNFALGIPGTVGGAIAMNAGTAKGTMADVLRSVTILNKDGDIEKLVKSCHNFSHRSWSQKKGCIILDCELNLVQGNQKDIRREASREMIKRKNTQPRPSISAGCFFRNPQSNLSAGKLIDEVGLKGVRIGGAVISERHANFIVNRNCATASDVLKLADLARKLVYKYFKIILEPEVRIVGD